jgi:hypothetical protein
MSYYALFWRWVHGEGRVELPGAAEFMQVLWEMGIYPHLEMFAPEPCRALKDWQTALTTLRQRLYIEPNMDGDARAFSSRCESCSSRPLTAMPSRGSSPVAWP